MARIYYKEETLIGTPLVNETINAERFDSILKRARQAGQYSFELQHTKKCSLLNFFRTPKQPFKYVTLRNDNLYYEAKEGKFFLPSAIIFYDVNNANFPSEFYFIAKVANQLELRKGCGGEDVKWYQMPELHYAVDDLSILSKVEQSFIELERLVDKEHSKQVEKESQKKVSHAPLSDEKIQAYKDLTNLCIQEHESKESIFTFIDTLKGDVHLNDFMDFLDKKNINFIIRLDWCEIIEELQEQLSLGLQNYYDLIINFPDTTHLEENEVVSEELFKEYDSFLREKGLQLGFIDTQSDEYIVLLHKTQDKDRVEQAVALIGYDYLDDKIP